MSRRQNITGDSAQQPMLWKAIELEQSGDYLPLQARAACVPWRDLTAAERRLVEKMIAMLDPRLCTVQISISALAVIAGVGRDHAKGLLRRLKLRGVISAMQPPGVRGFVANFWTLGDFTTEQIAMLQPPASTDHTFLAATAVAGPRRTPGRRVRKSRRRSAITLRSRSVNSPRTGGRRL